MSPKKKNRAKGTVGEGAAGKKAKATQHAGGQSVSEKSQVTRTSNNLFEKSNTKTQYFVREVKGRRMTKNGVEFLIGWRNWEEQYKIKTSEQLSATSDRSESPEKLFSSVSLVKSDLWGRLLDSTLIDVMWAKQVP